IVADELGVPFDDVEVLHGDTRSSYKGLDTYGSRSLAVGGIALYQACQKVVEKAKPIAARLLECDPADLEFTGGRFQVRGHHDGDGNLLSGTFVDYTLPSAADLPDLVTDRTKSPAPGHPLGAKGVGEAGTIAATPAVVNAVVDALRHRGVSDIQMPCTPERVWQALQSASRSDQQGGGSGS